MNYASTLTKSGQVTIPKELRNFLGIKPGQRIVFSKEAKSISIRRKLSDTEFAAALDANISPKTRKLIKENEGKSTNELMSEYLLSPQGQKEMRKKHAL